MTRGSDADLRGLSAQIVQPANTPVDENGNDVSLDQEVGEMIRNGAKSRVFLRGLVKLYTQMELAARDKI